MRKSFVIFLALAMMLTMAVPAFAGNVKLKGDMGNVPANLMKDYRYGETGAYIIVFGGPIEEPLKTDVINQGAQLVEYLPDFSFLALMTPEIAQNVKALSFIEDVMVFQPAYKIHPALKGLNGNVAGTGEVVVNIATFGNSIDKELKNAKATKVAQGKNNVVAKVNRQELAQLANSNNVKAIELAEENVLFNDKGAFYMDVDDMWNLGYDGSGQIVGIADTGLDTGVNNSTMHLDFQGRIDAIYALGRTTADDPHGHGTHVAGSVLGSGARSNGAFKGMAPAAHFVFQSVLDANGGLGGLPADLNDLFGQAYNDGARIHTNSWGAAVNDYTTNSANADLFNWNHRDMTILFAAGNDGRNQYSGRLIYDSIGTPGTAKNVITIGASETYRPEVNHSWADNPNEIAPFSSKGWVNDGRIKPDVVAPGTFILSTRSTLAADSAFWGNYDAYYAYMGGTSMATPLTAGAVAVAREYMMANWGVTPMASMMKAALINGATDLGYGVPSQDQGWGRVSLIDSLASKEYKYVNESVNLTTGQSATFNYTVASSATPFKVTLVWTDYPASTSAKADLVNDLDITVTSPSGVVYNGNDFASPYNNTVDRLNNVENVFISNPEVGTYTITVKGYNVPVGPQNFSIFASGDFQ